MARTLPIVGWPDVRDVPVYIYALTDTDGTVRYVGKSSKPKGRMGSHRKGAKAVRQWIASLAATGDAPGLVILHEVPAGEDADPWELHFILRHRRGGKLLNCTFPAEWRARQGAA